MNPQLRLGKESAMTQELVLAVLLVGLIGLVWAMTFSVLTEQVAARKDSHHEEASQSVGGPHVDSQSKQRSVTA